MDIKIDLVYTWVNGNDALHKKKRMQKMKELGIKYNEDANGECRFVDNEELKYSLRSVEKYANWVNNIYIITDNQVPEWLDTSNKRIKIIDHKQIIPSDALPVFNSNAIEMCIWKIPELSEYFLYSNDDYFFANKLDKSYFFDTQRQKIIQNVIKGISHKNDLYTISQRNAKKLIDKYFRSDVNFKPSHCFEIYKKSLIEECYKVFQEDIDKTIHNNFRKETDINFFINTFYSYLKGGCILRYVKKTSLLQRFFNLFGFKIKKQTKIIDMKKCDKIFEKYDLDMFCINDGDDFTYEDRKKIKPFLQKLFPEKSSFEK